MKFRKLKASEIECRIGSSNRGKTGFSLLLYKDARCDMNILDETLGTEFWQRDHKEIKGVVYCGVSIWNSELKQWITKWDAGTESNTEKQKGEASDSFKRSCFNLGLGRELYTSPFIWIKTDNYEKDKFNKYKVDFISYDINGVINGLSISCNHREVFKFGNQKMDTSKVSSTLLNEIGMCTSREALALIYEREENLKNDAYFLQLLGDKKKFLK